MQCAPHRQRYLGGRRSVAAVLASGTAPPPPAATERRPPLGMTDQAPEPPCRVANRNAIKNVPFASDSRGSPSCRAVFIAVAGGAAAAHAWRRSPPIPVRRSSSSRRWSPTQRRHRHPAGQPVGQQHRRALRLRGRPFGSWQAADFPVALGPRRPVHWTAARGVHGRRGPRAIDIPAAPAGFRGELLCVQVDGTGAPFSGNELAGQATLADLATGDVSAYRAAGLRGSGLNDGDGFLCIGGEPSDNCLIGAEYDSCPGEWIVNFPAEGSGEAQLAPGTRVASRLTVVPCSQNLRDGDASTVDIDVTVFNELGRTLLGHRVGNVLGRPVARRRRRADLHPRACSAPTSPRRGCAPADGGGFMLLAETTTSSGDASVVAGSAAANPHHRGAATASGPHRAAGGSLPCTRRALLRCRPARRRVRRRSGAGRRIDGSTCRAAGLPADQRRRRAGVDTLIQLTNTDDAAVGVRCDCTRSPTGARRFAPSTSSSPPTSRLRGALRRRRRPARSAPCRRSAPSHSPACCAALRGGATGAPADRNVLIGNATIERSAARRAWRSMRRTTTPPAFDALAGALNGDERLTLGGAAAEYAACPESLFFQTFFDGATLELGAGSAVAAQALDHPGAGQLRAAHDRRRRRHHLGRGHQRARRDVEHESSRCTSNWSCRSRSSTPPTPDRSIFSFAVSRLAGRHDPPHAGQRQRRPRRRRADARRSRAMRARASARWRVSRSSTASAPRPTSSICAVTPPPRRRAPATATATARSRSTNW